ncbi:hypothetical protein PAECIP111802_03080 [Paenibacillus allorhizosphaerae]|uniref:Uncharacterized protein n=1 Tax=Paenibacillus allorhizosphaerae TaxID=2849866 RepID=A0ABN7TNP2_9BACL|nr:hypothetical protein PAECIP111802_03080 [Paenibacillus allorhizosphaerae]
MGSIRHSGRIRLPVKPDPKLWVSLMPFGFRKLKPRHIHQTLKVALDNRINSLMRIES